MCTETQVELGTGDPWRAKREKVKLNPQKVWMEGKPLVATKLGRGFLVVLGDLMKSQPLDCRVGKLREARASFFTCLQVRGFEANEMYSPSLRIIVEGCL